MKSVYYAKRFVIVVFLVLLTSGSFWASPQPITGVWRTIDEKGRQKSLVKIYEENGRFFGRIIALTDPYDKNGKPKLCVKCKRPNKNKPYIGLLIIKNLKNDGNAYSGGEITDPEIGVTYKCWLKARGNHLEIYAYTNYRSVGRRQIWIR
ncbi:MAG: DUF2147 domain-containing protein [Spirochaetota bacterium]